MGVFPYATGPGRTIWVCIYYTYEYIHNVGCWLVSAPPQNYSETLYKVFFRYQVLNKIGSIDFNWFQFTFKWFQFTFNWFQFTFNWFQFTFHWFQFTFNWFSIDFIWFLIDFNLLSIDFSDVQLISTYFQLIFNGFQFSLNLCLIDLSEKKHRNLTEIP